MSILSDKYGVPEKAIKNMIKDGVIAYSWNTVEEAARLKREGKSIDDIAFELNMSPRNVLYLLAKVK